MPQVVLVNGSSSKWKHALAFLPIGGLVTALVAAGCDFSSDAPGDAVVLCRGDDDCPTSFSCDIPTHACVAADATPRLTHAAFEPPVTNGGVVRLVVRADRPLDPASPPAVELTEGSPPLQFALESTDETEQRLFLDADEAAEGLHAVARIGLRSAAGAATVVDVVGVSLVVDRTPPVVRNARITNTPADGRFADVTPNDRVEARFVPSEPIARSALIVAGVRSEDCSPAEGAGEVVCQLAVVDGVPDGLHAPVLEAADEAGNVANVELEPIFVDVAPPAIVAGSVVLTLTDAGRDVTIGSPTSDLRLGFGVSEDLGADPSIALDVDGVLLPLALEARNGRRYDFHLAAGAAVPAGRYRLVASLVDRFGHAAEEAIELPSPFEDGVPFAAAGGLCPPPPGTSCVDFDADGHSSVFSCADGDDPRDDDATVFPGAPELPGDGLDNNGIAGDLPIDENAGVFVDSEAGDDGGEGTRASPLRTLDAARALRTPARSFLFLASRPTPYSFVARTDATGLSLLGGLDPTSWARGATPSIVAGEVESAVVLDSIDTEATIFSGVTRLVLVRTRAAGLRILGDSNFSDGTVPSALAIDCVLGAISGSGELQLIDVAAGSLGCDGGDIVAHRLVVTGLLSVTSLSLTLVNSVAAAGVAAHRSNVTAVYSTLLSSGGPAFAGIEGTATLVASALVRTGSGVAFDAAGALAAPFQLSILASNLKNEGGPLMAVRDVVREDLDDIHAVNACAYAGCVVADANMSVPPGFTSAFHIGEASAMRSGAVVTGFQMPPGAVTDIDRDCRFADGTPDIGADEIP